MPEPMTREQAIAKYRQIYRSMPPGGAYAKAYGEMVGWPEFGLKLLVVPEYMHESIALWVLFGEVPEEFLSAVIEGDLFKAAMYADDTNRRLLFEYARIMHNAVPAPSKGPNALKTWKGLFPA